MLKVEVQLRWGDAQVKTVHLETLQLNLIDDICALQLLI